MSAEPQKTEWKLFGWQGVRMEVPADWELGAVTGDARKGTFRLDDEHLARLEVHWEWGRPGTELAPIAERHIDNLRRAAKKQKLAFKVDRDVPVALPEGKQAVCFGWKSDFRALNMLAFCPECRRVTLARVVARRGERLRPIAARVFASFDDHAREGVVPWALYGLRLDVPERFRLEKHALNLQRIELEFENGRERAAASRFNVAEIVLRGKSLRTWLGETYGKELNELSLQVREETHRGHDCLSLAGKGKRFKFPALRLIGMRFAGRIWRCEQEDKIYAVRWLSREDRLKEFEPFADSIPCH